MWIRVGAGVWCALVIAYWIGVVEGAWPDGWRFRLGLTFLFLLVVIGVTLAVISHRSERILRSAAIGLGAFAAAGPFLLNEWIRGDDRYVWVISQSFPCSTMGGGPGFLWVTATSWLFAASALVFGLRGSKDITVRRGGVGLGVALILLTSLAMFPRPEVFAFLLGCL